MFCSDRFRDRNPELLYRFRKTFPQVLLRNSRSYLFRTFGAHRSFLLTRLFRRLCCHYSKDGLGTSIRNLETFPHFSYQGYTRSKKDLPVGIRQSLRVPVATPTGTCHCILSPNHRECEPFRQSDCLWRPYGRLWFAAASYR